jgi:hypothetical protein
MFIFLAAIMVVLFLADQAGAWGVATHVELTRMVLGDLAGLGSGLAGLILAHRREFISGNIMADVIMGKKFSRRRRHSHHWPAAKRLLDRAEDDRGRAFAYGFMTHLAADTVAHNHYIPELIRSTGSTVAMGHLYWEMRLDQLVRPEYRMLTVQLLRVRDARLKPLFAEHVYPQLMWFGLNQSVFTRVHRFANWQGFAKAVGICQDLSRWQLASDAFADYRDQARDRMIDLVRNGSDSKVTREDPNGHAALRLLKRQKLLWRNPPATIACENR